MVPTRNRKDKLFRFLGQFILQTYPNLQIIVVDSNSTDGTREELLKRFPQVTLVMVTDNEYWAGATNSGIKIALKDKCEYIFTINDDSVVKVDHISKMVAIAKKHQALILGNSINYLSNPNLIWSIGTTNYWGTANFLQLNYHNLELEKIPEHIKNNEIIQVDALAGNGVLIHHQVFTKIGLYNESFLPHYHADSELTIRANSQEIKVFVAPSIILLNDFHNEQKKLNLNHIQGFIYALFHKKSHLFIVPLTYIFIMYCPNNKKILTLWMLIQRFITLRWESKSQFK
ncbi:glycosyltransferase family 2 protein [Pseudanabaena sp. FACHB-723]|uniref:Glycosyltransferase family 2 protein n=1 Tax=Pseudanabaena mucicola FACHB-723 TaxID=2692860 RepID=A0ABR7ZXV3_9CYAN|nr:glycosyltransferase family 2 protein [Pseudanabaena mucicola FACHB-723]